jgi:hypothetical protein
MRRYFKREAESEFGVGTAYLEISEGWPVRQVEVYGETWRWGNNDHPDHLADQPFEALELSAEHEISSEQFERVWEEALRRCPPRF